MAQIPYLWTEIPSLGSLIDVVRWANLSGATGDTGQPFLTAGISDKSVELIGTLPTFVMEGTNADPAEVLWMTLTNEAHTPITDAGGARIEVVLQNTLWIRPRVAGGATVTVIMVGRRPRSHGGTG